jgi:hypothetical protein
MRQMTSAQFQGANMSQIDEPVEIKRYKTVMGVYYPSGAAPEASSDAEKALAARVEELEEEVKALKRRLAAQSAPQVTSSSVRVTSDPFSGLSKQDREFFERKLGKKK